jgi:hypothetical protein
MSSIAQGYREAPGIPESGGSAGADESSRMLLSQSVIEAPSCGICRMGTSDFLRVQRTYRECKPKKGQGRRVTASEKLKGQGIE